MAVLADKYNMKKRAAFVFGSESTVCRQIIQELTNWGWYVYEEKLQGCTQESILQAAQKVKNDLSVLCESQENLLQSGLDECGHTHDPEKVEKQVAMGLDLLILGNDDELPSIHILENEAAWNKAVEKYEQIINKELLVIHHMLPLLDAGSMKRICYVNTADASINRCYDTKRHLSHIIGAARNMQATILMNRLQPEGYTFRIYACREEKRELAGCYAAEYFIEDRSLEPDNLKHSDECRLIMRDEEGREIPW
ncbi:MAG: family NAD(P)-dependent oxidoreductase [Herbinix sp.]|jgi:hypothetical protein|nr:family NAD(P)-dependent oxidoreductase [Herbinix sp.]